MFLRHFSRAGIDDHGIVQGVPLTDSDVDDVAQALSLSMYKHVRPMVPPSAVRFSFIPVEPPPSHLPAPPDEAGKRLKAPLSSDLLRVARGFLRSRGQGRGLYVIRLTATVPPAPLQQPFVCLFRGFPSNHFYMRRDSMDQKVRLSPNAPRRPRSVASSSMNANDSDEDSSREETDSAVDDSEVDDDNVLAMKLEYDSLLLFFAQQENRRVTGQFTLQGLAEEVSHCGCVLPPRYVHPMRHLPLVSLSCFIGSGAELKNLNAFHGESHECGVIPHAAAFGPCDDSFGAPNSHEHRTRGSPRRQ